MKLQVKTTKSLKGEILIPASKSHTIRAVVMASCADGVSELINPLFSDDTRAIINSCTALGAQIQEKDGDLIIEGFGSRPRTPDQGLDMLNSGTSTNLILGILGALGVETEITGDASLCSRPVTALADALTGLGCSIEYLENKGCPPLKISGQIQGSRITSGMPIAESRYKSLIVSCGSEKVSEALR